MENLLEKSLQLVLEAKKKGIKGLHFDINFSCSIIDVYIIDQKFSVKWKISTYFSDLLSDFSSKDTNTVTSNSFIPELENKLNQELTCQK